MMMVKMNKNEFMDLFLDDTYNLFFELADTPDLDKPIAYHQCKFCDYKTRSVNINDLDEVDSAIAGHIWNNHREIAVKKAMEYKSRKIAKTDGQKTLDEVKK